MWFSARDIDLLPTGPKPVRPHGVSQADFADEYACLVGPAERAEKGFKPVDFLAHSLQTTPHGPTLFVFDNFETVVNPADLFAWLDAPDSCTEQDLDYDEIAIPVGDFPIELQGMSEDEEETMIGT